MKFHFIGILLFLISALGFTLHSGQIPPYPYIKAVLLNIMVGATNVLLRYCSNINLQLSAYYLAEDTLAYGWPELCDNLDEVWNLYIRIPLLTISLNRNHDNVEWMTLH